MGYTIGFLLILAIIAIVITCKVTDSTFNRTIIIIATIVILSCNITCVVTDPPDPRVSVSGYTTSSGKKVSGYTRKYPGQKDKDSPYLGILIAAIVGTIVVAFYSIAKHDDEKEREREYIREKNLREARVERLKQTQDFQIVNSENPSIIELSKQNQGKLQRDTLPSWFYEVINYAEKIGAQAYVLENPLPKEEIDAIYQIKSILQKYDSSEDNSFITIHPKYKTQNLSFYIFGKAHDERTSIVFSTNPNKSYGHEPLSKILEMARRQIRTSDLLIVNSEAATFLASKLEPEYQEQIKKKAVIWSHSEKEWRSYIVPLKEERFVNYCSNYKSFPVSLWPMRFDKDHKKICEAFCKFDIKNYCFLSVEKMNESSLKLFQRSSYRKMQELLRYKHVLRSEANKTIYFCNSRE